MNTNVRFNDRDDRLETLSETLYQMAEALLGNEEGLRQFVVFGKLGARVNGRSVWVPDPNVHWGPDVIVNFAAEAKVEIGHNSRGKRLHLHVALKIRHRTLIRIDLVKLKNAANEWLSAHGFPYPIKHLNIRVQSATAEDYLDE